MMHKPKNTNKKGLLFRHTCTMMIKKRVSKIIATMETRKKMDKKCSFVDEQNEKKKKKRRKTIENGRPIVDRNRSLDFTYTYYI